MTQQEFKGYWWLPEASDHRVGGVLTFSPNDGVALKLFSALDESEEQRHSESALRFETIHGITTDNELITVCGSIRVNWNSMHGQQSQLVTSEHKAETIYVGDHFDSEPAFDKFDVEFPSLHGWFGKLGSESEIEEQEGSDEPIFIEKFYRPETVTADIEDAEIRLIPYTNQSLGSGRFVREIDAKFQVQENGSEMSLNRIREWARKLQAFMTLACGQESHFEKLVGKIDQPEDTFPKTRDIEILFSRSDYKDDSSEFDINKYTFDYSDIEDHFSSLMNDWFDKFDELEPVFSLFFSTHYNQSQYIQNEFLSLTRAIESYHRIQHGDQYLPEDEFEKYYNELVEGIPEKYDSSFRDHLEYGVFKYANEYSLRKRLKILSDELEEITSVLPPNYRDEANDIADTRNTLTHRTPDTEGPEPDRLAYYCDVLNSLIEIILLKEIGIPDQKIRERISVRYHYPLSNIP